MRDGEIAQSGRYDDLLKPGTALEKLVIAHNDSMQLVETENSTEGPFLEAPVTPYEVLTSILLQITFSHIHKRLGILKNIVTMA